MTDREMAEKYARETYEPCIYVGSKGWQSDYVTRIEVFLAGLKAGKPQWHDLRKNPNDLPDTDRNVWVKRESEIECQIDNYYEDDKGWGIMFREGYCTDDVVAWCELPKYIEYTEEQ